MGHSHCLQPVHRRRGMSSANVRQNPLAVRTAFCERRTIERRIVASANGIVRIRTEA